MRESGECGRAQARAERDETRRVRVRGGISSERLSNISGLFLGGRAGRTTIALGRPDGCSQVMQSSHMYPEGEGESVSDTTLSRRIVRGCT